MYVDPFRTDKANFITSSILVAEVRKPPDVAQPDDLSSHRQEKLDLVVPLAPLIVRPLLYTWAGPFRVSAIFWFTVYNGPALLSCHDAPAARWEREREKTKGQKNYKRWPHNQNLDPSDFFFMEYLNGAFPLMQNHAHWTVHTYICEVSNKLKEVRCISLTVLCTMVL